MSKVTSHSDTPDVQTFLKELYDEVDRIFAEHKRRRKKTSAPADVNAPATPPGKTKKTAKLRK